MTTTIQIEQLEKLLRLHCGNDELRPKMMKPFRHGEFYFAVDGYSLVKVPASFQLSFAEDNEAPNCAKVMPDHRHDPVLWSTSKLAALIETAPKVPVKIDCSDCGGDGYLTCDLDHEHECETCDGDGYYEHQTKVEADPDQVFVIGGVAYRVQLLNRIVMSASLIECEILKLVWSAPEKPCLFELIEGIELLISPARSEKGSSPIPDYIFVTDPLF